MNGEGDWNVILNDHPIFKPKASLKGKERALELSTATLPEFTRLDPAHHDKTPSKSRQLMVIREADLIVAVGNELRITSLGECKLGRGARNSYKVLHTSIEFDIQRLAVNPTGKLLAVVGEFQVAVVVLPRPGFTKLVAASVECKSIQVGQFYHTSATIAKVDWHPWGESGSALLVMTEDGKFREYDVSVDAEEPQQVLSFVPDKTSKSFAAQDASEREVVSFTLGKGGADWGPLTVYALMKSGDVYAICPYMPMNSSIPSSYVHTLECFVAAKREFLAEDGSAETKTLSAVYDYQHKYVTALIKQLPPGTVFPAASRSVPMRAPSTIKSQAVRQGPFLLQPSPRDIAGSEGGDATDIAYVTFGGYDESEEGDLGVVVLAYQDGRVDVCLDVEKIEARWESKQESGSELPMFAVYESVDLGLVAALSKMSQSKEEPPVLELLHGNHPVILLDPMHEDSVYIYHAFGLHALHLGPLLQSLTQALHADTDDTSESLVAVLRKSETTLVRPILSTFSVERRSSNPVIAVAVSSDIYLTYSIFILTSVMRIISFPLTLESDSPRIQPKELPSSNEETELDLLAESAEGPPAYISLLGSESFVPPAVLSRPSGLPSNPRLAVPSGQKSEFLLTSDTLRFLGTTVERFTSQIREVQLAHKMAEERSALQAQEFQRQKEKLQELTNVFETLKGPRHAATVNKVKSLQDSQAALLARLDKVLQSLMRKASPELSEHEAKWFEELRRMKEEVLGAGRYDERSLASRAKLLQREYDRLSPSLKELRERECQRKKMLTESNRGLGFNQAFELGERSNEERARIRAMEEQIQRLSSRLDIKLGRPPPLNK